MKKILFSLLLLFIGIVPFNSCEKNKDQAPEIPPYESMAVDFSKFTTGTKSASDLQSTNSSVNFASAAITVGYWNIMLTATLVIPVTAFYHSFSQTPKFLGDKQWQWEYDVTVLGGSYHARLLGTVRSNDVKWEMYISKAGIGAFSEFKWFEGTSDLDGNGGQWTLYYSADNQIPVLQIDWSKTGDAVGSVKYTYIRESDNGDKNQLTNGSYLEYGLSDSVLDAFYNIVYNTRSSTTGDLTVNIEWSTTEYNGRIKAEHYFQDTNWHCWDSQGIDVTCE